MKTYWPGSGVSIRLNINVSITVSKIISIRVSIRVSARLVFKYKHDPILIILHFVYRNTSYIASPVLSLRNQCT